MARRSNRPTTGRAVGAASNSISNRNRSTAAPTRSTAARQANSASVRSRSSASPSRSTATRQSNTTSAGRSVSNQAIQWSTYQRLQKQVDQAWNTLQRNVREQAPVQAINRAKNDLLLLLGECNYMARECTRLAQQEGQQRRAGRNKGR